MSPVRLLTLTVAVLLISVGLAVALGYFVPPATEPRLRVTVGVILVLMGLYRGVVGWSRGRSER